MQKLSDGLSGVRRIGKEIGALRTSRDWAESLARDLEFQALPGPASQLRASARQLVGGQVPESSSGLAMMARRIGLKKLLGKNGLAQACPARSPRLGRPSTPAQWS